MVCLNVTGELCNMKAASFSVVTQEKKGKVN